MSANGRLELGPNADKECGLKLLANRNEITSRCPMRQLDSPIIERDSEAIQGVADDVKLLLDCFYLINPLKAITHYSPPYDRGR